MDHRSPHQPPSPRLRLPLAQSAGMVGTYVWSRIAAQLRLAIPIVCYLLAVQVLLLGAPVADGLLVVAGVAMVVAGLAAFLEGLMLAIMPLGEMCGLGLPRRTRLPGILAVVFLLGLLATVAEPSIVVLQRIGESVTPWDAPLLFAFLNRHSLLLVIAIGAGVGLAFALGLLRLRLRWSLKPVLLIGTAIVIGVTVLAGFEPNLALLCGLSWDSGAITTSDVTVPLMLALGVGFSRMIGRDEDAASGFGSVALASLVPIVTVLLAGLLLLPTVPRPMSRTEWLAGDREAVERSLFADRPAFDRWAARHLTPGEIAAWSREPGDEPAALPAAEEKEIVPAPANDSAPPVGAVFLDTALVSVRAVIPLVLLLILIVRAILRRRLPRRDETLLGVLFCLGGMTVFTAGLEFGLLRLGGQTGKNLPALFQPVEREADAVTIRSFDPSLVFDAIAPDGSRERFFMYNGSGEPAPVPFVAGRYDPAAGTYRHVPRAGPRLPGAGGLIALLLVAFGLGFTATLMEPAVAALGITLENVTVGVFPRRRLVLIVAAGVGVGTMAGFAMLVWRIPFLWLLAPLYLAILVLTLLSSELFTGIAWDAGGATTASITVPLVLAIGSGLGGRLGTAESFGILALASGFPILGVILGGLSVNRSRTPGDGGKR